MYKYDVCGAVDMYATLLILVGHNIVNSGMRRGNT